MSHHIPFIVGSSLEGHSPETALNRGTAAAQAAAVFERRGVTMYIGLGTLLLIIIILILIF